MKAKHEKIKSDKLFYCFVDFGKATDTRPSVHILPSDRVAEVLFASHQKWLAAPGRNGKVHKDSKVRRFLPDYTKIFDYDNNMYPNGWLGEYRDAWHLLHLESGNVEQEEETC